MAPRAYRANPRLSTPPAAASRGAVEAPLDLVEILRVAEVERALDVRECLALRLRLIEEHAGGRRHRADIRPLLGLPQRRPLERLRAVHEDLLDFHADSEQRALAPDLHAR